MSEIYDRYQRHADAFEKKIAAVGDDQWSNQSPCEAWSARDVVDHVVSMHGYMLAPIGEKPSEAPSVNEDPLAAFRSVRADVESFLSNPETAAKEVTTPGGPMTFEEQIDKVISDDMVMHGWDLARATGQDDTMDPQDVQRLWEISTAVPPELMEMYRTPGAFGPGVEVYGKEVEVAEDASLQDRLLGYIGRNPAPTA